MEDLKTAPSGLVERVARAQRRRRFERTGRLGIYDDTAPLHENELDDARAAIEAMREPTDAMIIVGSFETWQDMIDAALAQANESERSL